VTDIHHDPATRTTAKEGRQAGFFTVARAVFWSFLGIRRKSHYQQDAVTIKPHQVIIAGIVGAVLFVLTLVLVVNFVIAQ
jgi:hypothetical protein